MPSKAQRIANFHGATVHSAIEIVGALGVSGPAEVRPHRAPRRPRRNAATIRQPARLTSHVLGRGR